MLIFPAINPVAFSLGPLQVHWYGLMYLLAFTLAWLLARWRVKHYSLNWTQDEVSDVIFYGALGVILGGRIGYMLFYNTQMLVSHPLSLFKIWQGGMSFHGGLLGVAVAMIGFSYKTKKTFLSVTDFIAPLVPFGLAAGRLGNFINGELWGRTTTLPWGMVFPHTDGIARHPSQLYEFALEGILLGVIVWCYSSRPRPAGCVSAIFLIFYGICRLFVECFRAPDQQLGFIAFHWLTMGQLLSLPMVLVGLGLWWVQRCKTI